MSSEELRLIPQAGLVTNEQLAALFSTLNERLKVLDKVEHALQEVAKLSRVVGDLDEALRGPLKGKGGGLIAQAARFEEVIADHEQRLIEVETQIEKRHRQLEAVEQSLAVAKSALKADEAKLEAIEAKLDNAKTQRLQWFVAFLTSVGLLFGGAIGGKVIDKAFMTAPSAPSERRQNP